MKDAIKIVSLLSFVALMFIKVSGFHVYSHSDNDSESAIENCVSCELAIEQQQNVFTSPTIIDLQKPIEIENVSNVEVKHQFLVLKVIPSDFFSRPPPATI